MLRPDDDARKTLKEEFGIELPESGALDEAQAYMDGGVVDRDELHELLRKELIATRLRMRIYAMLEAANVDPNDVDPSGLKALLLTADSLASLGPDHLQEMGRLGDEMKDAERECARDRLAADVARLRDEHSGISDLEVARRLLRDHGRAFDRNDSEDEERAVHALRKRIARLEK